MSTLPGSHPSRVSSDLVKEACIQHPDLPSRTIARMLFTKHRRLWSSVEAARIAVRYRRGRHGDYHRRRCNEQAPTTAPSAQYNPDTFIPPSDEEKFTPFVISDDRELRILVLQDIHVPYHSYDALKVALDHGKKSGCNAVLLNGDVLDFHRLSRFQKDPLTRKPKGEIDRANQLLDAIDDMFPKARKIFKEGNHDERYDHYITVHAEEVFALIKKYASLPQLLELEDRGWEYVGDRRPIYTGKLTIIHGHEYPQALIGPVNAARGLFIRAIDCALVGHHHQTSEHTGTTIRDKIITTWSVGCLCDLHPRWCRFNKWNHGFGIVNLSPDGSFAVRNYRIHEGQLFN